MNTSDKKLQIANRIAESRKSAGLSQGQLAKLMEMHRPTISEIEAGRRNVTAEELGKLSQLLAVRLNWLACDDSDNVRDDDKLLLAARELRTKLKPPLKSL